MMMTNYLTPDGEAKPLRWGHWHLACFEAAYKAENPDGDWKDLFDPGYVFRQEHKYIDPDDGEVLHILPGETFKWWWN